MIFRFGDLFIQRYGFSTHLRGAFFSSRPRFSDSTAFTDTHELSDSECRTYVATRLAAISSLIIGIAEMLCLPGKFCKSLCRSKHIARETPACEIAHQNLRIQRQ